LAGSLLTNALCLCGDLNVANTFITHGFDSREGPYVKDQAEEGGASVGVNGSYTLLTGAADIGGSFSVAGSGPLMLTGSLIVRGDFWSAANISALGSTSVSRHAWLSGSYSGAGPLTVAGTLHHGGTVVALPVKAGTDLQGAVKVPSSCPCGPDDLVDVAALVASARVDNDNVVRGVVADQFAALAGQSSSITLPCGRIYLTSIGGVGQLTFKVTGRSAVFIDGSVALSGGLTFDVAPGAEVDVFVKGDLKVSGKISLASKEHPAAGRLWVGGSQPIALASPWTGMLYAPHAPVTAAVALEAWGGIFAASLSSDFVATFIFDRSIGDAGAACSAPPPAQGVCRQCGTCPGSNACVAGLCQS